MFCNFCGKKIAPEDRVCPYCGQAQESRSGGNGFWDILTNPSAADDADPEPVRTVQEPVRPMREPAPPMPTPPVPSDRRRRRSSRGILILSIITVVLLLASIALDVLLFLNIVGINTKLETISEALTEVDGSTEALAPETTPPASSETKAPTEPTSAPTTAATGEPSTAELYLIRYVSRYEYMYDDKDGAISREDITDVYQTTVGEMNQKLRMPLEVEDYRGEPLILEGSQPCICLTLTQDRVDKLYNEFDRDGTDTFGFDVSMSYSVYERKKCGDHTDRRQRKYWPAGSVYRCGSCRRADIQVEMERRQNPELRLV